MNNFEYVNIDEILSTNNSIRGSRIDVNQDRKIIVPKIEPYIPSQTSDGIESVELHVFLPNTAYIGSSYDINTWKLERDNTTQKTKLSLDIHRDLGKGGMQLLPGSYRVVYNFFRNLIGSYNSNTQLFISEISTDRTELKLSLVTSTDAVGLAAIQDFVLGYLRPSKYLPPIILNFGENKILDVINVTSDGSTTSFFVKLYNQLPADLDLNYQCWVGSQILKPWIDTVNVIPDQVQENVHYISGPNFEVDYDYWISTETDYKSWNEILSSNVQTSQEILNRYISGSNVPVTLNVNFREFENFIFYSSAEERVNNFFYKVGLVEYYNNELDILNTYTGSLLANKIKVQSLKDKVISGFDDFEKWLYYETTGSNFYTTQATASVVPYPKYEVASSSSIYTIATKEGKYVMYSTGSTEAGDWYDRVIEIAQDYDLKNYNALNKAIPEYLREDTSNDQFTTFVNMIGQHFDVMYLYTDHLIKKNLRKENPKDGLSQDLIFDATRNLGWTLSHGTQAKDLWEYALGVSGSGEPIWTGKTTTNKYLAKTSEERTKEIWRRILNNLPYIYKTKGTPRAIKALLSAYGIPQSILSIREFGGPDNADIGQIPRAEWEKQTYFLRYEGSYSAVANNQSVRVPWERINDATGSWKYPDTVTMRWKMEPNSLYSYSLDQKQTVLQKNSGSIPNWFVMIDKDGTDVERGSLTLFIGSGSLSGSYSSSYSSSITGSYPFSSSVLISTWVPSSVYSMTYKSASITDEYLFDDVPLNIMIRRSGSFDASGSDQRYDLILKTNKYGKIAVERSASILVSGATEFDYNTAWSSDGQLYIGSGSNSFTNNVLSGSIYELRYWSSILDEASFDNHVLAARAYNGNTSTSSFYDLQAQFKFWTRFDAASTGSIHSSHPDQNKITFFSSSKIAYLTNFSSASFESINEVYNMEVATVGSNTPFTEKVRVDSGSLQAGLSPIVSTEVSAFDNFSLDSNKLMVAFSPQNVINEDIYEAIGNTAIDDYFGEYSNIDNDEYPRLKWFAREYWQKYPNKNDFTAYIKLISIYDFSIFDQIRQTLPARVNEILGLVIEPNILERSKVKIVKNFSGDASEKYVQTTNEISSSVVSSAVINSHVTKIVIGFDDDSELIEIDGDSDLEVEVESTQEVNVGGDINKVIGIDGTKRNYLTTITASRAVQSIYSPINSVISVGTGSSIQSNYYSFAASISSRMSSSIIAESSYVPTYGELDTAFDVSYARTNAVKNGSNWTTVTNDSGKSIALFSTVQTYNHDSYYSAYKFNFTGSTEMRNGDYYSSSYVDSKFLNPHTLTTSIRNQRFDGCKLSGPDVNVASRETPDGKGVVEILYVDPNTVNVDGFFGSNPGGNLTVA